MEENNQELQQISYKLVILGDIAVGKSSIAQRYFFIFNSIFK